MKKFWLERVCTSYILVAFFEDCDSVAWLFTFLIPYFSAYKTEALPFQNNPKNLDPSYKMDLDLWDCLGRTKFVL